MIEFKPNGQQYRIAKTLGKPFSWHKKLQFLGVGSHKVEYVFGIPYFDAVEKGGQDLEEVSFELYPQGLVIRYSKGLIKRGVIVQQVDIKGIDIHEQEFRNGEGKIRVFGMVRLDMVNGEYLLFFMPSSAYRSFIKFWKKAWLKSLVVQRRSKYGQ